MFKKIRELLRGQNKNLSKKTQKTNGVSRLSHMIKFVFYKNYSGSSMGNGFEETKPQEERMIKRLLTIAFHSLTII